MLKIVQRQGDCCDCKLVLVEIAMIARQEQVASEVRTTEAKKRWVAPEVTRLEFAKTAGGRSSFASEGTLYNHS